MRGLWRRRPRQGNARYLSVLDLGASSVKALVIEQRESKIRILGRGWASSHGALDSDGSIVDAVALSAACEEALCTAEDATSTTDRAKIVPDIALFAVPTAWLEGAAGTGGIRRTALESSIVLQECAEPLLRSGRHALRNLGRILGPGKWDLVDAALATFSIDGRRVTSPVGFRGYLLEASSFVVAAPEDRLNSLQWVAEQLRLDPPCLVAEPLALAAACPGEGLIVNAGAHTTGLALVRYGAPLACGSVQYGGALLTQVLAEAFELPIMRAEALKRGYNAGQLSEEGTAAVRQVLEAPLQAWTGTLIECLSGWTQVPEPWPPDIYVSGGVAAFEDLRQALSAARWLDRLPFPRMPEVRLWDGSSLYPVIEHGELEWRADQVVALSVAAWTLRERGAGTPEATLRSALAL